MSNIDKRALREEFLYMQDHYSDPADRERQEIYIAAEAVLDELESKQTFQQAFFRQSLMYDVVAEAYEEAKEQIAKDVEIKARLCLESNSLFDRLRAAEKRIAELTDQKATWVSWAENASGMVDMLRLRIAELERSETQLINERDYAESALNDAYKAVMGQAPEWSNWFSFENAIDEIELVCELWRNQTDDVIQFRQRIQELEAKLANPVLLPKTNGYWNEQEKAYEEAITLAKQRIRMAGFRCEGDE
ncbi:ead/Ea22-like family protein [Salmonella enterica]|uniref:Ead-like protein n=2 Tax=Salmonella enterica TaxID=28901 RepID=A0A379QK08_SALER|nr:ead/Ea22-like family protein [Salmonella enterica]SUF57548.1 Ead-like protein [Salmonella enterica]